MVFLFSSFRHTVKQKLGPYLSLHLFDIALTLHWFVSNWDFTLFLTTNKYVFQRLAKSWKSLGFVVALSVDFQKCPYLKK